MIKVWLDDEWEPTEDWYWVKTTEECVNYLRSHKVDMLSLDYDLGDNSRGTGLSVAQWLTWAAQYNPTVSRDTLPHLIAIHSSNEIGKQKIRRELRKLGKNYVIK